MKQTILLLFTFLFTGTIYSQTVSEIINNSFAALNTEDFDSFKKEYTKLYLQYIRENEPNYINAIQNTKSKDYKQTFENLDELIQEGYMLDEIKEDKNFKNYIL